MAENFRVNESGKLLEFLFSHLHGWSKKTVKQRLKDGTVAVNGRYTTKHDFFLIADDFVTIGAIFKRSAEPIKSLEILYQDRNIVAINKPAGLLSVGTITENREHALAILRTQLGGKRKDITLFPVHRLDRDTSGVLLFATTKEKREKVMENWNSSEKLYLAVVKGTPKEKFGTIDQPLRLDTEKFFMHVGEDPKAKKAVTHYEVKESREKTSLLEVRLETGRQHQIRVHLAWLGHAILGDERYGKKGEKMGLHAYKLTITHPVSKMQLTFEVKAPKEFYALLS
jgi:23S rRNA pseudouridine1911/1915/1917 synthase